MQPRAVRDGGPQVVGAWDDFEVGVAVVVVEVAACVGEGGDVVLVAVDDADGSGVGAGASIDVEVGDVLDEAGLTRWLSASKYRCASISGAILRPLR